MSNVNTLTIPEEEDIIAKAMAEWQRRKIQVLIDDDDEPPENSLYFPLEHLVDIADDLDIKVKIYVQGEFYKLVLREWVDRRKYLSLVDKIQSALRETGFKRLAHWSREEKAILVPRWELQAQDAEVPEVPVIQPGKGVVGTMHGGGVE